MGRQAPGPGLRPDDDDQALAQALERNLAWLVDRCRGLSRAARERRRRREAHVVLTFDEAGRVTIKFRPEETPDS